MTKASKRPEEEVFQDLYDQTDFSFIQGEIRQRIKAALEKENLDFTDRINLEHPDDAENGDYSTNLSFVLAKKLKKSPVEIGQKLAQILNEDEYFRQVNFAAPGFINFFLSKQVLINIIAQIDKEASDFGTQTIGQDKKIQVEFISANPTGPLTVPNARGGFTGDTLARVYTKLGFVTEREYYINDFGNQIAKLGESVFYYYRKLQGQEREFPEDGYQGEYIEDIAKDLHAEEKDLSLEEVQTKALQMNIESAKKTVARMGIDYDTWFAESSLHKSKKIQETLDQLIKDNKAYEKDGAWWLRSTEYYDDKDRVLIRDNKVPTYIMGDLAYHTDKFRRDFDKVINIWGADHHGDVARLHAGLHFLGIDDNKLKILLVSLMKMEQDGKEVRMSKRKGVFVLMNDLLDKVPLDVLRFFSQMYDIKSPMVFDLDLALDTSERNPVYYVQYAHARLCSILRKAPQDLKNTEADLSVLTNEELFIIKELIRFPELLVTVARDYEVHLMTHYAIELAKKFHAYYQRYQVLSDDQEISAARLKLVAAVKIVLANTLDALGVEAPEKM
ncbi:arginine--tRNA ligase [Patescibacteria group bacterium]|nr:arginine--tRNA ligase [Patescibacteria group bacterium]